MTLTHDELIKQRLEIDRQLAELAVSKEEIARLEGDALRAKYDGYNENGWPDQVLDRRSWGDSAPTAWIEDNQLHYIDYVHGENEEGMDWQFDPDLPGNYFEKSIFSYAVDEQIRTALYEECFHIVIDLLTGELVSKEWVKNG